MKTILAGKVFFVIAVCLCFSYSVNILGQECGETKLTEVKDKNQDVTGLEYKYAYSNYNDTYKSYRAIFITYDKAMDSDFKRMEGDERKLVIMVFTNDQSKLTPGTYTIRGSDDPDVKNLAVGIMTSKGENYAASYDNKDIGSVVITRLDDEMLCGEINVTDSRGMTVKGTFSLKNEPVR
jgi:hypothetical protein